MGARARRVKRFTRMVRGFGLWDTLRYAAQNRAALHPGLSRVHRWLTAPVLREVRRTGRLPLPRFLSVYPTWRCNLACAMCHQRDRPASAAAEEFSVQDWRNLLEGPNGAYITAVRFLGGEAFVRADLPDLFDVCEAHEVSFYITTNGTLFRPELVRRLERYRSLAGIVLSLDGPREVHNRLRGRDTAFDRLVDGVRLFESRERLSINSVVTADTVGHMQRVVDIAADLGIRRVGFNLEGYVSRQDIVATQQAIERITGTPVPCLADVKDAHAPRSEPAAIRAAWAQAQARGRARSVRLSLEPRMFFRDLDRYASGETLGPGAVCGHLAIDPHAKMAPTGDLFPCEGMPLSFGNLFEQDLSEIWNSPSFCALRKALAHELPPRCRRCCLVAFVEPPAQGRQS